MKMVVYLDWHSFMAKDDWATLTLDKHPGVIKAKDAIRVRLILDVPDQVDGEQMVEGRIVKDADGEEELVEKNILAAGDTKSLPAAGCDAGPGDELEYQNDIKIKINNLLWEILPASATMKEAEDVATDFWCQLTELRDKYKCTGVGS